VWWRGEVEGEGKEGEEEEEEGGVGVGSSHIVFSLLFHFVYIVSKQLSNTTDSSVQLTL